MNYYPPTLTFVSLAEYPFERARVGDLGIINEPDVNVVVGTREFSPEARTYADALDVVALARKKGAPPAGGDHFTPHVEIGRGRVVHPHQIGDAVSQELGSRLPRGAGKNALLQDLTAQFSDMSAAIKGRRNPDGIVYSGDLALFFIAKLPGSWGPVHRDFGVDVQGLIPIHGQGSIGADDSVRQKYALPGANPLRERTDNPGNDNYGRPSMGFAEILRQLPAQRMTMWTGAMHAHPFMHAEPEVRNDAEARLIAIARPYENSGY